ncbi:MAG TPA: hypothetical protein VLI41_06940 [Phenylobacterium sp.]|uniref:hypothetical protein n=1 Tax=Phenylobacterium sp. TaxID=1871053 RepID=UPI002CA29F65|nr:hypothetical protein [Phenylobacterium sp.]HSV02927.1 hypothetical protein [Phenylobacterium sp.]
MTTLRRAIRQKPPPIVVRVRRTRRRTASPLGPRIRRDAAPDDLSSLILYGQAGA